MAMFELGRRSEAVDRDGATPLHTQVTDLVRARIASGEWRPRHRLPTEPELAAHFGISRDTLRRALSPLLAEGILRQVRGRGTFVTDSVLEPAGALRLRTLSEDFESQHAAMDTRVLSLELAPPTPRVAAMLAVPLGMDVVCLVRVRCVEGVPVALLHNFVRADLAPGIEHLDFTSTTLFGELEGRYGLSIDRARRSFSAVAASGDICDELGLAPGAPVQYLEQRTLLADGQPIEYSDVWINSDELRVTTTLLRR